MLIHEQIDEYAGYKYQKHPFVAGAHRAVLLRLANEMRIKSVKDITENMLCFFVGEQLTGYYSMEAIKAIRAFLWFCERAGYTCINYRLVTEEKIRQKPGPKPDYEMVENVHALRDQKFSYNRIVGELRGKYPDRTIHRRSIMRWATYSRKSPTTS